MGGFAEFHCHTNLWTAGYEVKNYSARDC